MASRGDHAAAHDAAYDVLVIGAGPAGSSAAAALAVRGWSVLLVERDRFPRHKVCGEFLSPEAQGSLHALGFLPPLAAQGPRPLHHVEITAPDGRRLRRPLPGAAWGISRYALDRTLAETAQTFGVTLRTGVTATHTAPLHDAYQVTLRQDGQRTTVTARAVLAAAGRQSRATLFPQPASRVSGKHRAAPYSVGVKRHYAGMSLPGQVELFLFAGGYAGLNPIENGTEHRTESGRANLCLLVENDHFRAAGATPERMIAAAAAANPALAERLAGARPLPATTCTVGAVDTYSPARLWDGLPRLGDAALMLPPFCGDGMAMALRGAELCVAGADAYLRDECSLAQWEAAYTQAWRAEFAPRLRLAHLLQRFLLRPSLAGRLLTLGAWLPWAADYAVRATRGPVPVPSLSPCDG